VAARGAGQQVSVVGFLDVASAAERADYMRGFVRGLAETGYIEGQNVAIEYRWADNKNDRLPSLAARFIAGTPGLSFDPDQRVSGTAITARL
jgi:putative ABC transport system substrate-binding protein